MSVVLGMSLISLKTIGIKTTYTFSKQEINPLVLYGESIFKNEKCLSCHTLTLTDSSKISLDGFETSSVSSTWLYHLFENPKQLIARCRMPSFAHLLQNNLSKTRLQTILIKQYITLQHKEIENEWEKMMNQSDSITNEIYKDSRIRVSRKEVLALIAYLKQIPSSPLKVTKDSLQKVKDEIELAKFNDYISNQEKEFKKYLKDKKMIEYGEELFQTYCSVCHRANGKGDLGPSLVDNTTIYGEDFKNQFISIYQGRENGMPEHRSKLKTNQITELIVYIHTLRKK